MEFLSREILFGFSLREIVIAILVIWILSGAVKKLFQKNTGRVLMKKKCRGCTWTGPASDATKRCPKCHGPLITTE